MADVVPLGAGHLCLLTREYVEHYHRERNHQGLENRLLQHGAPPHRTAPNVQRRGRLGGLLNFYHREAAVLVGLSSAPHAVTAATWTPRISA